jgi:hypothetical protein
MEKLDTLNEIANFTFTTKYARYDEKKERRETWKETVDRVKKMHLKKFNKLSAENKQQIEEAFKLVEDKYIIPSMRSMQFGGKAVEAHNARIFNCSVKHIDSIRSFAESFYALLCGVGVGFGITDTFLDRLPNLVSADDKNGTVISYTVQDSIEGWSDSIEALLNCYFKNTAYSGRKIVFDYSKIRPRGAKLKTGGGKAPGYKGLKNCHKKVKELLDYIIEEEGQKRMRTINAYDILMHCADAVLSGGIRRSACSVIFDANDTEMMNSKTGNWFKENPQRARSNNSAIIIRGATTKKEFQELINKTKEFGEPGFLYVIDNKQLLNPCFTIDSKILTVDGWRTFENLLGKEIEIIQDNRVIGKVVDNDEVWDINTKKSGVSKNIASNIRKTGENQDVYLLSSTCGRQVKATGNHLFATPKGMVSLDKLKAGDKLLIGVNEVFNPDKNSKSYELGFISGLVYGDGNVVEDKNINVDVWDMPGKESKIQDIEKIIHNLCEEDIVNQKTHKTLPKFVHSLSTKSYDKYRLSSSSLHRIMQKIGFTKNNLNWIHNLDKNFKSGFLSGLFYSDGHVDFNNKSRSISLRITSNQFESLQNVQLICQELGIFSKINNLLPQKETVLPDGKGGYKKYLCKPTYPNLLRI